MGLDMYLSRHHYVKLWDHTPEPQRFAVSVTRGGQPYDYIDPARVSYVIEEVAYWRKVNAVHNWFVQNCANGVDNCRPVHVSKDKLKELAALVRDVVTKRSEADAEERLPTASGFFFGSVDYDDWYWKDLEWTADTLERLLDEDAALPDNHWGSDYYYEASW